MFNNEILRKSSQQAANFKMPYLVPPSTDPCNYCDLLKKYPNLAGTHVNGCKNKILCDKWIEINNKPGCKYCNQLELMPNLVGTHSSGCPKDNRYSQLQKIWRQNPIIDPNTGEKWWIE
jgi:hypothetical protein